MFSFSHKVFMPTIEEPIPDFVEICRPGDGGGLQSPEADLLKIPICVQDWK